MPFLDVYVGCLGTGDDPLDWGGEYNLGNIPHCLKGTLFPPSSRSFSLLTRKIRDGKFQGKQVDWGAFAANVSKSDILAFIEEVYAADPTYKTPDHAPHLYPKLQELLDAIHALPDDERFALVAEET